MKEYSIVNIQVIVDGDVLDIEPLREKYYLKAFFYRDEDIFLNVEIAKDIGKIDGINYFDDEGSAIEYLAYVKKEIVDKINGCDTYEDILELLKQLKVRYFRPEEMEYERNID